MLKSKKLKKTIAVLTLSLSFGAIGYLELSGTVWNQFDYQVLDHIYKKAVATGYGVKKSRQIVYLIINEDTYHYFQQNTLSRHGLARVNDALTTFGAEAVAYDLIFARPAPGIADKRFANSIRKNGRIYLPVGFSISQQTRPFIWKQGRAFDRLRSEFLGQVVEKNNGEPWQTRRASMQLDSLFLVAKGSGHISALSDEDGVYRHVGMLVRVDSLYMPTLTLSMFLDYVEIPFDSVKIAWGKTLTIPALEGSYLEHDLVIPINGRGMTYIPFVGAWGQDFNQMTVQTFLERTEDPALQGALRDFFEGTFVFIGEASIGIADLGTTPLEKDVPLIAIHAAMMNAFLNGQFYSEWSFGSAIGIIAFAALVFGLAACFKRSTVLYATGLLFFTGLFIAATFAMVEFSLFPLVTIAKCSGFIFLGLVAGLQIAISKEQLFIRNAFSKYVPDRVITELLAHPDQLQLGGEERELTVLFCDLAGFTSLSETIPPRQLVRSLNDYFSEMTSIILEEGGIIDKYLGDAIMAEFGAPLRLPDHPVSAVHAAVKMQKKLAELQQGFVIRGKPCLRNRIGINTGQMVVGNMGSHQTFDYTVIGDAVNLASRLESANKWYGSSIMISERTFSLLPAGIFRTRLLDSIKVKGKSHAIRVYEVYGLQSEDLPETELQYYLAYEEALAAYFARNFKLATELFMKAEKKRLKDPAAKLLLRRIRKIEPDKLADDWDGSFALSAK
ncbi:adenylate/guanylate cyclase domain-containing protein [candidate division KSB1 bacterium]|nr:adenylate/guanylate cyclase domain-containing protein [candidate division KSB1 bacterium]